MRRLIACGLAAFLSSLATAALAHPHVFSESRMEIVGTPDGHLKSVRNVWRMDELFSASVLVDFDKNADGQLDETELAAVGAVVKDSIAEWGFYTFVEVDGRDVPMAPPDAIRTLWRDGQLIMFFEMMAPAAIDLKATPATFSVFDDSFFVAFDFVDESAFDLLELPAGCSKAMHVPDPDAAAEEWMADISMLSPDETIPDDGVDWASAMSTTLEVRCG